MTQEVPLLRFGDVVVSHTFIVTPSGTCRLDEARTDSIVQTRVYRVTPTWAVVVAFVFILSIVSLLFLFVKEDRTSGAVQLAVYGPGFTHTAHVRVRGEAAVIVAQRDIAQIEKMMVDATNRPQARPTGITSQ